MMVAQVAKEANSGSYQLMSHGPADLLLSHCSDYWDGAELKNLTKSERQKFNTSRNNINNYFQKKSFGFLSTTQSDDVLRGFRI